MRYQNAILLFRYPPNRFFRINKKITIMSGFTEVLVQEYRLIIFFGREILVLILSFIYEV